MSVLAALAVFLPVRFEWFPLEGAWAFVVETLAILGVGVVLGIMCFGFFGLRPAVVVGAIASVVMLFLGYGFLRDYATLTGSLVDYAVSFLVCWGLPVRSGQDFDFDQIARVTGDFDPATEDLPQVERVAASVS